MKYLIVGLGNIGPEYRDTRHNIGFRVLDALAGASNAVFEDVRYGAVSEIRLKGRGVILLKPNTYMNLSGKSVAYWVNKEKIALENILVIVDDLALPFASLRLRGKGSAGGHNGLKSINELLGTEGYARLRCGIGSEFGKGGQVDYVLGEWTEEESEKLPEVLEQAGEIIKSFVIQGLARTMNSFNKRPEKPAKSNGE
ncbi:MAG: aminoacyl-tRNA hydrolase [Odoribacter sp.]|nr:aminoacyl-tRNA hydrolase [Bacteroidales bacterium]MBR2981189.1 aminoacyl-tRNA hydrolase [Odoribacter sp.]